MKFFVKVNDEDAKVLIESIYETEAAQELYNEIKQDSAASREAVKAVLETYLKALRNHKRLWSEILVKYLGEDDASMYYNILRFDIHKKVIFDIEIEGCLLCNN